MLESVRFFEKLVELSGILIYMEATMIKEALICGIGMVVDLSGSHYLHSQDSPVLHDGIHADWKQVGNLLQYSINSERPKIEAEVAKQLQLKLG
jgi:hypothetical protein